jgi:hypothetical protein
MMTNLEFSRKNEEFKAACEAVGLPATKRQASKWQRQCGRAYVEGRKLVKVEEPNVQD